MEASWKQQVLRLLAPVKLAFANGVAIDHLRLGFGQAELSVSGSAGSKLDLTASLRDYRADIGAIANPAFAADGVIAAMLPSAVSAASIRGRRWLAILAVTRRSAPCTPAWSHGGHRNRWLRGPRRAGQPRRPFPPHRRRPGQTTTSWTAGQARRHRRPRRQQRPGRWRRLR